MLPYNAHTTASDALWAGLPVLICKGNTFAGRVAASVLRAAGLPDMVVSNLAAYEAQALALVRSPHVLADVRVRLAENRLNSPLFDAPRLCQNLESAYQTMWNGTQNGIPPQSLSEAPPVAAVG